MLPHDQLLIPLDDCRRYLFENFLSAGNEKQYNFIRRTVATINSHPCYLHIHGPAACGKTHILYAWLNHTGGCLNERGFYISARDIAANGIDFLDGMEQADYIGVDDMDASAGSRTAESAIVALIDKFRFSGKSLISVSREDPNDIEGMLPDLRSRLNWGIKLHMKALKDDDKAQALKLHMQLHKVDVSESVLLYLLSHFSRDMTELVDLLYRSYQACLCCHKPLTIPLLKKIYNTRVPAFKRTHLNTP